MRDRSSVVFLCQDFSPAPLKTPRRQNSKIWRKKTQLIIKIISVHLHHYQLAAAAACVQLYNVVYTVDAAAELPIILDNLVLHLDPVLKARHHILFCSALFMCMLVILMLWLFRIYKNVYFKLPSHLLTTSRLTSRTKCALVAIRYCQVFLICFRSLLKWININLT